jgi:hypothetical protein
LALLLPFMAVGALILAIAAAAGPQSTAAGFEGDDANLAVDSTFDWNGFAPTTWTGDAPYRQSEKTVNGWVFNGIEDDEVDTGDTAFAGGTKQDDACATVGDGKAPNKDDLKRIYIANKTVGGEKYIALAWARIPQNTTSSSAHVAFEFNQNETLCGGNSDGLVTRSTANGGDMLIVYDFEGGSAPPVLKLLRWQSTGTCEASGKSAATNGPCWVFALDLTAQGFAEAAVNTQPATDNIAPTPGDVLQSQEFGEAIVNLTDAGVFPANPTTCLSFGKVFGVSRSSGNSAQAQMKDLVGPAEINIANCGQIIIRKETVPDENPNATNFAYTNNVQTLPGPTNVGGFTLQDDGSKTITDVKPGTGIFVTETNPSPLYALTNLTCTAGSTATNVVISIPNRTVTFDLAADQTIDCTFTNTKQKQPSTLNTAPFIYPNDTATITQTDATGSVAFKLYGGATPAIALANCQANSATGLLYSETVNLPAASPKTVSTSNPGTTGSPTSLKVDSSATVYWRVEYSGDTNYFGRLSNCTENIAATLTADNTGGSAPAP